MTYQEKLKDPRWQKMRLMILNRDNWSCQFCGDKETTLHVHHKKYNGEPWKAHNDDLITCCQDCHLIIEHCKAAIDIFCIAKHDIVGGLQLYAIYANKGSLMMNIYNIIGGVVTFKCTIHGDTVQELGKTLQWVDKNYFF